MGATEHRFVAALSGTREPPGSPPPAPSQPDAAGYGVALLSRYPVSAWETVRLPAVRTPIPDDVARPSAAGARAGRAAGGRGCGGGHPAGAGDRGERAPDVVPGWNRRQLRRLMGALRTATCPIVLMGDLTWTPADADAGQRLQPLALAPTFPVDEPVTQLDHILTTSPGSRLRGRRRGARAAAVGPPGALGRPLTLRSNTCSTTMKRMAIGDGTVGTETVRAWVADLARLDPLDDADRVVALRALEELKARRGRRAGADHGGLRRLPAGRPRSPPGCRPGRSAPGSAPRSRWPGGTAPPAARGIWAGPGVDRAAAHGGRARGRGRSASGGPPWSRGRPPASSRRTGRWSDAELAALPGGWPRWATGAPRPRPAGSPTGSTRTAFTARSAQAAPQRRVSLRPAPDTMTSDRAPAGRPGRRRPRRADAGTPTACAPAVTPRSRGQIMADTLVERVTGQATAAAVPVEVQLVMTDNTLLGEDPTPAECTATARSRHRWARAGWPTPPPTSGCAGSTPARPSGPWSRWTPPGAGSPAGCAGSWSSGTRPAAPPGAAPRSATPTTPPGTPTAAPPPRPTARACARPATTPNKPPAGAPAPVVTVRSTPAPPPATTTLSPVPPNPVAHSVVAGPPPARSRAPSHLEARLHDVLLAAVTPGAVAPVAAASPHRPGPGGRSAMVAWPRRR